MESGSKGAVWDTKPLWEESDRDGIYTDIHLREPGDEHGIFTDKDLREESDKYGWLSDIHLREPGDEHGIFTDKHLREEADKDGWMAADISKKGDNANTCEILADILLDKKGSKGVKDDGPMGIFDDSPLKEKPELGGVFNDIHLHEKDNKDGIFNDIHLREYPEDMDKSGGMMRRRRPSNPFRANMPSNVNVEYR